MGFSRGQDGRKFARFGSTRSVHAVRRFPARTDCGRRAYGKCNFVYLSARIPIVVAGPPSLGGFQRRCRT